MNFQDIKVLLEELVQCYQPPDISVSEWAERWYGTYVANRDITEKSAANVPAEAETLYLAEDWRCANARSNGDTASGNIKQLQ